MSQKVARSDATVSPSLVRKAMAAPYLDREEEHALAVRWRDHKDQKALHRLTTAYMRLVISIAAKFRNYGLPMSDLVQEGNIGLMQAAARFDPDREVRFSTYAVWWIRAQIQDYILRNWSIVRTGTTTSQKSLFFNLRRLRAMLDDGAGPRMSMESRNKIATALKVSAADVESMEARLTGADFSLNAPMGGDDGEGSAEWMDQLSDENPLPDQSTMESIDGAERQRWLTGAMSTLNARERDIIRARKLNDEGRTLESIGDELGISKERVRQIEARAMEKLKDALIAGANGDPAKMGLIP